MLHVSAENQAPVSDGLLLSVEKTAVARPVDLTSQERWWIWHVIGSWLPMCRSERPTASNTGIESRLRKKTIAPTALGVHTHMSEYRARHLTAYCLGDSGLLRLPEAAMHRGLQLARR